MTDSSAMSAKERNALLETVKLRARVAKADADKRGASLRAEVEQQLSATFKADDDAWSAAIATAREAVKVANDAVAARCRELGIRPEFAPQLGSYWNHRGENATPARRIELRKLAHARIDAAVKEARHRIESWQASAQERLLCGLLRSEEAQVFLVTIPTAEALLPPVTLAALEGLATQPSLRLVSTA